MDLIWLIVNWEIQISFYQHLCSVQNLDQLIPTKASFHRECNILGSQELLSHLCVFTRNHCVNSKKRILPCLWGTGLFEALCVYLSCRWRNLKLQNQSSMPNSTAFPIPLRYCLALNHNAQCLSNVDARTSLTANEKASESSSMWNFLHRTSIDHLSSVQVLQIL